MSNNSHSNKSEQAYRDLFGGLVYDGDAEVGRTSVDKSEDKNLEEKTKGLSFTAKLLIGFLASPLITAIANVCSISGQNPSTLLDKLQNENNEAITRQIEEHDKPVKPSFSVECNRGNSNIKVVVYNDAPQETINNAFNIANSCHTPIPLESNTSEKPFAIRNNNQSKKSLDSKSPYEEDSNSTLKIVPPEQIDLSSLAEKGSAESRFQNSKLECHYNCP